MEKVKTIFLSIDSLCNGSSQNFMISALLPAHFARAQHNF